MFLSLAELHTLTGYRRGAEQCAWLDRNGVPYYVSRSGRPSVLRSALGPSPHSQSRPPAEDGAVYRWSFDMVTCGDERWAVFGPFTSKAAALTMLHDTLPEQWLDGWRIINEHCAAYCGALGRPSKDSLSLPVFEFYREAWTDG